MATVKITLNGESVPYSCFIAGADICPELHLNYDHWPDFVLAENVTDTQAFETKLDQIFDEVLQRNTAITFEVL